MAQKVNEDDVQYRYEELTVMIGKAIIAISQTRIPERMDIQRDLLSLSMLVNDAYTLANISDSENLEAYYQSFTEYREKPGYQVSEEILSKTKLFFEQALVTLSKNNSLLDSSDSLSFPRFPFSKDTQRSSLLTKSIQENTANSQKLEQEPSSQAYSHSR